MPDNYKLITGDKVPGIGFGTWNIPDGDAEKIVGEALGAGYKLVDTAKIYGNERGVGRAVQKTEVARKDIFVTTKLWTNDQGFDSALHAFDESLKRLGLDYIDLYLIHWPGSDKRRDSWRALEKIQKNGQANNIGVSNYMVEHLDEVLKMGGVIPAVNQIEFHPFVYEQQRPVLELCKQNGIVVEAYSPLARGHHMNHPDISEIADRLGKTNAQVMLRWCIEHGTVPIPKSSHPERLRENLEVFDFELTEQDMKKLNGLGT